MEQRLLMFFLLAVPVACSDQEGVEQSLEAQCSALLVSECEFPCAVSEGAPYDGDRHCVGELVEFGCRSGSACGDGVSQLARDPNGQVWHFLAPCPPLEWDPVDPTSPSYDGVSLVPSCEDRELQAEASVSGAVDGDDLAPVSVVAGVSPFYGFGRTMVLSEHTAVRVTDFDNTCAETDGWSRKLRFDLFQDATQARSAVTEPTTLQVWLPDLNGGPIPTGDRAVVTFSRRVPGAGGRFSLAQSGSVELTEVSEDGITGTFDLAFDDGDRLTGTFRAPICEMGLGGHAVP